MYVAPAEILGDIFQPFRLGLQSPRTAKNSLGLGLFITQRIVQAHGGEISVASEEEAGTTFTIRLPGAVRTARGGHGAHGVPER